MREAALALLLAPLALGRPVDATGPDRRVVSAPSVSLREAPGTDRGTISRLALGTLVREIARTGGVDTIGGVTAPWLHVSSPAGEEGWLFGALTLPWSEEAKDTVALEIASDRLDRKGDPFESFAELHSYLAGAADAAGTPAARARLELAALRALERAGEAIGFSRLRDPKVLAWVDARSRDLVWNEPAARWIVVADRYWELHDRSASLPVAEEIAWAAARAQLPGECEGDIPCHLEWLARTDGRYLAGHPGGAHAGAAISNVAAALDGAVEEPRGAVALAGSPPEDLDRMKRDLETLKKALAPTDDSRARAARSAADVLLARAGESASTSADRSAIPDGTASQVP